MIGMDLLSFLILLVIGIVVAAILHYGFRFYVIPGTSSFLCKVVLAWLGPGSARRCSAIGWRACATRASTISRPFSAPWPSSCWQWT